ncbi:MAG: dipeptidase [bacterium]
MRRRGSRSPALALVVALAGAVGCDSGGGSAASVGDARALHERLFVMDMHVDSILFTTLYGTNFAESHPPPSGLEYFYKPQADLPGLVEGGTDAVWLGIVVWPLCDPQHCVDDARNTMRTARRVIADNSDRMQLALSSADIERIHRNGKMPALMGLEGAHGVGPDASNVATLYEEGLRYIGLAHFTPNGYANTNLLAALPNGGLTDAGRELIQRMNRLGMIVDLAHTHPDSIRDALAISEAPVIVSHTGVRGVYDVFRNLSDDDMKAIAEKGGVIGVFFASLWLTPGNESTVEDVVDHIEHVVKTVGIDHVGIGSDYDGIVKMPTDLPSAASLPVLTEHLVARGYGERELAKLYGENMLRVFREVERTAARLRGQ